MILFPGWDGRTDFVATVPSSGGPKKRIATSATTPAWSPDGEEIGYTRNRYDPGRRARPPAHGGRIRRAASRQARPPTQSASRPPPPWWGRIRRQTAPTPEDEVGLLQVLRARKIMRAATRRLRRYPASTTRAGWGLLVLPTASFGFGFERCCLRARAKGFGSYFPKPRRSVTRSTGT